MADNGNDATRPDIPDNLVELARIDARVRQTRIIAITVGVIVGFVCITIGVVKVVDEPPWVTVVLALIAAIFGPSGLIILLLRSRNKFVKKHHRRVVELEMRLDSRRTSSTESDATQDRGGQT